MTAEQPNIPDTLSALAVPVTDLRPYSRNPRNGDIDLIEESLRVNGQYRPIVVRTGTGEVLAGNHTLHAAMSLGWTHIAATFIEATDEQAARIVLVDNRANDLARYDDGLLAQLLQDLPDLDGTGYDQQFLDELLAAQVDLPPPLTDPDDVPAVPAKPISAVGDVWLLGPHRLTVGDSTDVGVLDRVMAGGLADCVWTDPPYGVEYVGKTQDALTIDNDGAAGLDDLLRAAFAAVFTVTKPGAPWYTAAPAGPLFQTFGAVLGELGVWRQTLTWVKDALVLGRSHFHYRHEPIFYGWHPGASCSHPPPDRKQDTIWEIPRPKASREHPTMKPVALIERALTNSTDKGWTVLDPFAGSGTTLIACHQQARVARLIEIDPRYADVICRRYQEATGTTPILESTSEPVDFTREH